MNAYAEQQKISPASILPRIAANLSQLTPKKNLTWRFAQGINYLGYTIRNPNADASLEEPTALKPGHRYEIVHYFLCEEPVSGSIDLHLTFNSRSVKRGRFSLEKCGVGGVVKYPQFFRIPYSLENANAGLELNGVLLATVTVVDRTNNNHSRELLERQPSVGLSNLIGNPGFESLLIALGDLYSGDTPLNNWSVMSSEAVDVRIDEDEKYSGKGSLRLDFLGGHNPNYYHVKQKVLLESGGTYLLTYKIRTDGVTSERGIGMEVDMNPVFFASQGNKGNTDGWKEVSMTFDAPKEVTEAVIRIRRQEATAGSEETNYGYAEGTVWFDDVRLERLLDNENSKGR